MSSNPLHSARFVLSTPEPRALPADRGTEIAFAGRSNAGKSSALNALVGTHGLARTSRTPGRTQHLVVFALPGDERRLIDLPGYGYAKVPDAVRLQWRGALEHYLQHRQSLRALALVMDIRHPLTPFDHQMLAFCAAHALPCHVLLTKADKLGRGQIAQTLLRVQRELAALEGNFTAQAFSAPAGTGVEQARTTLAHWLAAPPRAA